MIYRKPAFKGLLTACMTAFILLALMCVASFDGLRVTVCEVQPTGAQAHSVTLPWQTHVTGEFRVHVTLGNVTSDSARLRIYPDDELLAVFVNGRPVSLQGVSPDKLRDYADGFVLKVTGLIPDQANELLFVLHNESGPAGFNLKPIQVASPLRLAAVYVLLVAFALVVMRHVRVSRAQFAMVCASLALSVLYLSATAPDVRTYDVFQEGGHLDYIRYVQERHALPDPGQGWEYHQPPLYYLIGAAARSVAGANVDNNFWGQVLALQFWTAFLVAGLGALCYGLRGSRLLLMVVSMAFAFWPAGIIHSIRIGNDVPLYAFFGLSFLYAVRWWSGRRQADLAIASVWMLCAVITKSNGLAMSGLLLGMVGLAATHEWWRRRGAREVGRRHVRALVLVGACCSLGLLIGLGDNLLTYLRGTSSDWLLSNVGTVINSGLRVSNTVSRYVIFDTATFLQEPFMSSWDDRFGRQYFWNYLLRSSLSAEFSFHGKVLVAWGLANGWLLLAALLSMPIYLLQKTATNGTRRVIVKGAWRHLPWLGMVALLLILLIAYRIKAPYSCNTDFRYIYPALLGVLYLIAQPLREARRFRLAATLSLAVVLIGLSSFVWIAWLLPAL